jgi:hypothetical protein
MTTHAITPHTRIDNSIIDNLPAQLGIYGLGIYVAIKRYLTDFSVVLFRPNFMLASEGYPMKAHKNQWLSALLSSPNLLCGATNQGTYHGVWGADAFAVT